ncbi:mycothiol system anti-sigma-R factor [Natronocella acetinitrilica]|uniref:Mycothiol system anti-sigma-R factor n=1 Tax=Natronocella acetinitrilica TaxID=414046 RepID=A0AAE3G6H9_9GAMM|nr:zf-HC2 domain-containing protein [Natronocella acetinitrilica]MCP1676307.1 mycothiol system anti-sigma-R factor [Natronocella acetinitrilica]
MSRRELSCEEVVRQLLEYLDQELDAQSSADIEHHLKRCRDCFTRAEFEKKLRSRVTDAASERAPEQLQERIKRILENF